MQRRKKEDERREEQREGQGGQKNRDEGVGERMERFRTGQWRWDGGR